MAILKKIVAVGLLMKTFAPRVFCFGYIQWGVFFAGLGYIPTVFHKETESEMISSLFSIAIPGAHVGTLALSVVVRVYSMKSDNKLTTFFIAMALGILITDAIQAIGIVSGEYEREHLMFLMSLIFGLPAVLLFSLVSSFFASVAYLVQDSLSGVPKLPMTMGSEAGPLIREVEHADEAPHVAKDIVRRM